VLFFFGKTPLLEGKTFVTCTVGLIKGLASGPKFVFQGGSTLERQRTKLNSIVEGYRVLRIDIWKLESGLSS
jgi:hypothetical protein